MSKSKASGRITKTYDRNAPPPRALMEGRKAMDELSLIYDDKNKKDINWLASILGEIVRYPSVDLADRHRMANKLGSKDIKTPEQIAKELEDSSSINDEEKEAARNWTATLKKGNQTVNYKSKVMKRCNCCGLLQQEELLNLSTDLEKVNRIGMSTSLYFMALRNLCTLLLIMLGVFSIFAVATNIHSSKLYKNSMESMQPDDQKAITYNGMLVLSLGSKLYYKSEFTELTYDAQCWLGTMTVLIWAFAFIYIKRVQKQFEYRVDYLTISAGDFSVLASHIPIKYYNSDLKGLFQYQLTQYVEDTRGLIPNYDQIFGKIDKPIQINSVNRVSVINLQKYYNEENHLNDGQLKELQEQLKKLDKKWVDLIEQRRKKPNFSISFEDIEKMDKEYTDLRKRKRNRYKIVSEQKSSQQLRKVEEKQEFDSFSAFITFQHTQNKQLIERLHERQKSLIHKLPCFHRRQYLGLPSEEYQNAQIRIEPAPEPEDIIWANYSMTASRRFLIQVITFAVTIGAIALSFLFVFLLSQAQAVVKDSERKHAGLITTVLSGVISLVLFVINYLLTGTSVLMQSSSITQPNWRGTSPTLGSRPASA